MLLHCGTAAWIWSWDALAVAGVLQRAMAEPAPAQCVGQKPQVTVLCAVQVTEDNKKEYVNLVAQHRMTTAIREQLQAFLSGFWDLVPKVRPRCASEAHPWLLLTSAVNGACN